MLRREFFGASVLPFFGGFFKQEPFESEFGLGKYVKHSLREILRNHEDRMFEIPFYSTLVNFPVECTFTIYYEYGYETYLAFNVSKNDFAKYAKATQYDLKKMRHTPKGTENFMGATDTEFPLNGKYNFRLSCVTLDKDLPFKDTIS